MASEQSSRSADTELGRFLRARRTQTSPGQVGLTVGTGLRRTPGLRREELATLAGISIDDQRVGAPQHGEVPLGFPEFMKNVTFTGGVAPARAYIEQLLPDVLEGRIEPGRVFDRTVGLAEVPDGYRAMTDREALKVLVRL